MACCGVPIISHNKVISAFEVEKRVPACYGGIIPCLAPNLAVQPDLVSLRGGVFGDCGYY